MKFTKMQAYCNDYVYVITFDQEVKNPAAAARGNYRGNNQ